MGLVLENKLIQDLQLRVLQEFFKIQMQAAFGNRWVEEVERDARQRINDRRQYSNYIGITNAIDCYGIENFNETRMDVTALTSTMLNDTFRRYCDVGSDFFNVIDAIRKDKNALASHISNFSDTLMINKLIYQSLDNLSNFLTYLKTSWNYSNKIEFVNNYLAEISELTGEKQKGTFEKALRNLPFSKLQEMVNDEIPEAELEMYLRMKYGYIKENEYDEEKKENLLKKASDNGLAEAEARLALDIFLNKESNDYDKDTAYKLLGSAARKGSPFVYYVYGCNAEFGIAEEDCEPNLESAYEYYCEGTENGCIEAAVKKAYCMAMDIGIQNRKAEGRSQLKDLVENTKNAFAYLFLGKYYYETEQYELAFKTFKKGDNKTHDNRVAYYLAKCYYYGKGTEPKEKTAFSIFKRLENKGFAKAKLMLADCYYYGNGTDKNETKAFEYFEEAAKKGNADAIYMFGKCLFWGQGVDKDHVEAVKKFKEAALLEHIGATYMLGKCYANGLGTEKSTENAFKCFKKAAKYEHSNAEFQLGLCYYYGEGTDKNETEAFNCFKNAVENGNIDALYYLGECYYYGRGVGTSKDKAVKIFKKASNEGYSEADYMLGIYYRSGNGIYTIPTAAIEYFEKAAQKGHAGAACQLGIGYHYENNLTKAFENFELGADLGDSYAMYWVGLYNIFGYGESTEEKIHIIYANNNETTINPKHKKAWECFYSAAKQDNYLAQEALAYCYYYGIGCHKDNSEALKLFSKIDDARKSKHSKIQYMLGLCLYNYCVEHQKPNDFHAYIKAFKCFENALKLGYSDANYMLGLCYYYGKGTEKSKKTAFDCFKTLSEKDISENRIGGWQVNSPPPSDVITKIKDIAKTQEKLYANNEYMLGICFHESSQIETAKKHYKNAAEKGHEKATAILDFFNINEEGINDKNIERLKGIALMGFVVAIRAFIAYLNKKRRYKELEDFCLKNRWLNELTDQYISSIQPLLSLSIGGPSLLDTYKKAVDWINKARNFGYEDADQKLLEAKEKYEKAKKIQETFNLNNK